jgi:hypothetical protein
MCGDVCVYVEIVGGNVTIIILVKVKKDGLGIILQRNNLLGKMMTIVG